jgi:hypothetical protein
MGLMRVVRAIFAWVARKVLWFFDLIYGGVPAEFESAFDLDESVRRLAAVTRDFAIFPRERVAVGEVSRHWVSIRKPRFWTNSFVPFFKGEFCEIDGRVRLVGWFTLSAYTKTVATVWFGGVATATVLTTRPILAGDLKSWPLPLGGIGMFAFGLVFAVLCKGKRATRCLGCRI